MPIMYTYYKFKGYMVEISMIKMVVEINAILRTVYNVS
jgi:hypothetical protein